MKAHLREGAAALGRTKVLLVRRPERRHRRTLRVFWGSSPERNPSLFGAEVEHHEDLLELDLAAPGEPIDHPLFLVCTHGKHDRCCARHGRPLYEALREQADEGWVWQCTHVGGDRFAGNVVVLPEGLYFGRISREQVWPLVDDYLARRLHLDTYRGRSCYPFAVQAAESAVRQATGLAGIDEVELVSSDPIHLRAADRVYEVEVEREAGELTYLTCSAETLRHPRRYAARSLRVLGA